MPFVFLFVLWVGVWGGAVLLEGSVLCLSHLTSEVNLSTVTATSLYLLQVKLHPLNYRIRNKPVDLDWKSVLEKMVWIVHRILWKETHMPKMMLS